MTIDSINILTAYGVTFKNSKGELDFPKIKRPFVHNWDDEHGIDIDLTTNVKESRTITMEFLIQADTAAEYETNLTAFQTLIEAVGLHTFVFDYLVHPLSLVLNNEAKVERLTGLLWDQVSARISCEFLEPTFTYLI